VVNGETWDSFKIAADDVGQNTWELWELRTGGGSFVTPPPGRMQLPSTHGEGEEAWGHASSNLLLLCAAHPHCAVLSCTPPTGGWFHPIHASHLRQGAGVQPAFGCSSAVS
jgi:hypothetical protein